MKENHENSDSTDFIDQLIEKDKIIKANPFLFTRIKGKIQENEQKNVEFISIKTIKIAIACTILILAMNIYLIATYSSTIMEKPEKQTFEQFSKESHFDMINFNGIADNLINE
jgi:hypothetical protein